MRAASVGDLIDILFDGVDLETLDGDQFEGRIDEGIPVDDDDLSSFVHLELENFFQNSRNSAKKVRNSLITEAQCRVSLRTLQATIWPMPFVLLKRGKIRRMLNLANK